MSTDEFARLLASDLAGTFPRTASAGDGVDPAVAQDDLARVLRDGYVILRHPEWDEALRMAKDVQQALMDVIAVHGGKSPEEAKAYLEAMRKSKRYQRDVY